MVHTAMLLRLLFAPFVLLYRALLAPLRAFGRSRAAPPGALVELRLRGRVHEAPARPRRWWPPRSVVRRLGGEVVHEVRIPLLRRVIDEAIADPRVAGVVARLEGLAGGWASMQALREELARVPAAGKRLVAFLPEGGGNAEIFVATAAPTIVAPKSVDVALTGPKAEAHYFKRALDKAGVDVELMARKEFKSAGDRLAREGRSDADRLQTEALLDAIAGALIAAIAEGRRVEPEAARALIDLGPTRASVAKARGLVDLLAWDDELPEALGAKIVPAGPWFARRRAGLDARPLLRRRRAIAVVEVHGSITSAASPLARSMGPVAVADQVIAELRACERDPSIAGVVLDVDSPGGTVVASDAIWAAARRVASKKPMVARMGDVAASGGYYVSLAGRAIVARPLTITGSIGVVAVRPIVERLAARLGVARDVIVRGKFADLDALSRAPTEEERALLDREIDGHYEDFVSIVAEGRKRPFEEIEPLARGRVYAATDARAVGLVDRLGGFEDAVTLVREALPPEVRAALDPTPRVLDVRPPSRRVATGPEKDAAGLALVGSILALLPPSLAALARAIAPALLDAPHGSRAPRVLALATDLPPMP
jgi:protease-4